MFQRKKNSKTFYKHKIDRIVNFREYFSQMLKGIHSVAAK